MENEKQENQIQIKIDGNICTINYPEESQVSKSKISNQNSLNGSFGNIDDLTLTISKTTEDFIGNHNKQININNNVINNINNSNEKSKLEITFISIFNSDKKSEISSNKKTPIYQLNDKNINNNDIIIKKYEKEFKDSVIKKLNFDICDTIKETETIKKNPNLNKKNFTSNISKNLNERYFIHQKNINNNENNNYKYIKNNFEKSKNDDINNNNIGKYIAINKSTKYFKNRCKSFHKEKKVNNKILVDSNGSILKNENNSKNVLANINNHLFSNNSNSKININKSNNHIKNKNIENSKNIQSLKEKKEKLKNYFDKLTKVKTSIKSAYLKLKSGNNLTQIKKEQKLNPIIKAETNNLETEEKININSNNNKDFIMKTTKKIFPQLSSANSFNTSNSKKRISTAQLSSIKKNYHFLTPSTTNIKGGQSSTTTKGTFSSSLNSPVISSSSKIGLSSKIDSRDLITKLYYNNSSAKNLIHNKNNKNFENATNSKLERKKDEFLMGKDKENVKYFLKRHNTDLKNVLRINNKKIQKVLSGKKFNFCNNFGDSINNSNKITEINEFKQFIQKNQFDKELLKTIKKRGSFH